ncbi:hydantoinase/carbamoylase family amidase [Variovorax sp. Varisp62]|uniref:hydantoinase/carbamoylase family amidase n=1 Tax=Variovorax sp. Varisp62 TaxID=3243049 RepID=UPI0039B5A5FC
MSLLELQPMAEKLFSDVRELTFDGVGVTRQSYGRGESDTADYLRAFAASEGLEVKPDRAANLVFGLPGTASVSAVTWTGSHIDSVPQGGNFDGYAGVVAGLLCLVAQKASGRSYDRPLEVVAFRGEESAWFGKAYMGSGALLGKISESDLSLKQRTTGESMETCMRRCGADVDAIRTQQLLLDKVRIKAYIELHIEQGPVMVARKLPLAVVSGIRGNVRHNRVVCHGDAQHSGVVPRWLRHDAMFAVADLIMRIDEHWRVLLERGTDLVVTTGIVSTDPVEHSISRIPGQVSFSLEARSKSTDTLEAFYQLMRAECAAIERERGVRFEFDGRMLSEPATMDGEICGVLANACTAQDAAFEVIPSGAGHDASLFANAGIPSGMLFVRNQNGSHNPHEAMEIDDFMLGVRAMDVAFMQLK